MQERRRDTEILPIIHELMPKASNEEKLQAMADLWSLFDNFMDLLDRLEERGWFDAPCDKGRDSASLTKEGSLRSE